MKQQFLNILILFTLAISFIKASEPTPFDICNYGCYGGESCNDCDTAITPFYTTFWWSGVNDACNTYLYAYSEPSTTAAELSTAHGNCAKAYATTLQDGAGKTYMECYGQCGIDNVMEIDTSEITITPPQACQSICMGQNNCGENSNCYSSTLENMPHYYMNLAITECEIWGNSLDSDHYSPDEVSAFFGDCIDEMLTNFNDNTDEKNFLTCLKQCTIDYDC